MKGKFIRFDCFIQIKIQLFNNTLLEQTFFFLFEGFAKGLIIPINDPLIVDNGHCDGHFIHPLLIDLIEIAVNFIDSLIDFNLIDGGIFGVVNYQHHKDQNSTNSQKDIIKTKNNGNNQLCRNGNPDNIFL